MRQQYRLGPLHMSVSGQNHIRVFFCQKNYLLPQPGQAPDKVGRFLPEIHAHVKGHLVVAAPGSVQFQGNFSDLLEQSCFDVHVYIFKAVVVFQLPSFNLAFDITQPQGKLGCIFLGDNTAFCQHFTVRNASGNIIGVKPFVHLN